MTDVAPESGLPRSRLVRLHPLTVRLTHWLNAAAIIVMIGSGWRIYDWSPLYDFQFPFWMTLGGDRQLSQQWHNDEGLAGALQWHFAAMWVLFLATSVYVVYGIVSGHFRRSLFPVTPRGVLRDTAAALTGHLAHDLGRRNHVQKALYLAAIALILLMLTSGLAIWKPVQFQELAWFYGGYDEARYWHFYGMAGIVAFLAVHVGLTVLVPKVLPPMITGRARIAAPSSDPESAP